MSSFTRESTAFRVGGSSRRNRPRGPQRPRPRARPAGRPPPSRSGRPPARPTPPLKRSLGSGPRSPPHCRPKRWPGRPSRQSRRGESAAPGTRSPGAPRSVHAAGAGWRPEPRTLPPAQSARPARGHLLLGPPTSRLPLRETKVVTASPLGSPSPPGLARRRSGAGRAAARAAARVRPVALSAWSSFHYIICSFSEGWAGAGGLGREETFATFLHSFSSTQPPHTHHHHQSALKKQC